MQKWGKNRNGSVRWRCKLCGVSHTRKRSDLTQKYKRALFKKWLLGKQSLVEIALKYNASSRTLHSWFTPFWEEEPQPKQIKLSNYVLIIDGKYVEKNASVLVGATVKGVVFWMFSQRENYNTWSLFLLKLRRIPFAIVCDGQKGMIKAIKERFPGVVVQRCQFHVVSYILSKLTQNPESIAAQELRYLVTQISKIKIKDQLKLWLAHYKLWYQTHHSFLKEKTYQEHNLTPTGRRKWHYTHGKLHASHSHLKNSLPNLFKYLLYPQIPNTTNYVEGAINSPMQEKLRFHRGLKLFKRRVLIAHFLSSKQR